MNYISFHDSDGNQLGTVPVESGGGTVRIGVGEPGHSSGVWRVWAGPNHADVYIAGRTVAGEQKFSLHKSGHWRYGFTEWAKTPIPEGVDRAVDKWERPDPVNGTISAVAIQIRDRDVVDMAKEWKGGEVIWIDPPPEGHYVSIRMSLLLPDVGIATDAGGRPQAVIGLVNDTAFIISSKVLPITPIPFDEMEAKRQEILDRVRFSHRDTGMRTVLFSNDENRVRYVYDMAILPEEMILADPPQTTC